MNHPTGRRRFQTPSSALAGRGRSGLEHPVGNRTSVKPPAGSARDWRAGGAVIVGALTDCVDRVASVIAA